MSVTYQPQQILDKLQVIFNDEGLEVVLLSCDSDSVHLKITRVAEGMPTAIIVKAIEGTFKRYHPTITKVVLDEYVKEIPEGAPTVTGVSAPFAKLFKNQPALQFRGLPGLDLKGADKHQTAQAIEVFVNMLDSQNGVIFRLRNLSPDAMSVIRQWANLNACYLHQQNHSENMWVVHTNRHPQAELRHRSEPERLAHEGSCCTECTGEFLPYALLIASQANPAL